MNEFNRGMNRLITRARLEPKKVMRKELGELVKTLVKVSPPKDRNKSIRKMREKVDSKFEKMATQANNFESDITKPSKSGLKYWAANSKFLFAGAADADMTKANAKELRAVMYRMRKQSGSYRLVVPFTKPRRLQRVAISTRIIATKKQIKAVADKIAYNFGRLKAGWLAPMKSGAVSLGGKFNPPKWVKNHMPGLRGAFINGLNNPGNPSFVIINRAKGVSEKQSRFFIQLALRIRAKAMAANADLILSGKKDYTY